MARSAKAGGKRGAAKARKAKGRKSPKASRPVGSPIRLKRSTASDRELKEAREQQAATAEILKVINSSQGNLAPVFDAILEKAMRLCDAGVGGLFVPDGEHARYVAMRDPPAQYAELLTRQPPLMSDLLGRNFVDRPFLHIVDVSAEKPYLARDPIAVAAVELGGIRTIVSVPLRKDDGLVGVFTVYRQEVRPFTTKQIALLQSFADQAVIAIENARLFNETREALERQTATAEILKVIASSPSDVQPVLETVAERTMGLLDAWSVLVTRFDGELLRFGAARGALPDTEQFLRNQYPMRPETAVFAGRCILERSAINISDAEADPSPQNRERARLRGFRAALSVPMLRDGQPIGVITVSRKEAGAFSANEVELLQTFADQAVIAIENARLFEEVRERTIELTEALEQQTATAEVLVVISSSAGDLAPVFDAMLGKAMQLCSANFGVLNTYDGMAFHTGATYGLPPAYDAYRRRQPLEYGPGTAPVRLLHGEPFVQLTDLRESEAYRNGEPNRRALVDIGGARCLLAVPLLKDEQVVGNVMIFRQENRPFSQKQIALLQQFAAQAVIAIENTRLLRELRESTEDLSESLQQQTATSDLLQVISRSAFDLQPIFDAIAERAVTLCGADRAFIYRFDGELLHMATAHNTPAAFKEWMAQHPMRIDRHSGAGRAALERRTIHIHDVRADREYTFGAKDAEAIRTILGVPILKGDELLGVMMIYHLEGVRPFTEKQIALVETFADQAAIAIENVRLFDQLQAKTRDIEEALQQQTATSDVLEVINRSAGSLIPVFDAVLEKATQLCEASFGVLSMYAGNDMHRVVATRNVPQVVANLFDGLLYFGAETGMGRLLHGETYVHILDAGDDEGYRQGNPIRRALVDDAGTRTYLAIPLRRENTFLGAFTIYRREIRPFTDKQIALVQGFAAQAVIAIENTRLFNETKEALERQTATSNVLQVISQSMAETAPVFESILDNCEKLFQFTSAGIALLDGNEQLQLQAARGPGTRILWSLFPQPLDSIFGAAIRERQPIYTANMAESAMVTDAVRLAARKVKGYSLLQVPILWQDRAVGSMSISRLPNVGFSDKEVALLKTFAEQAVIAIENARLFNETKEALERQTATADILKVIASSPDDVQPVFDAIAEHANRLIDGHATSVVRIVGDVLELAAHTWVSKEADATLRAAFPIPIAGLPQYELMLRGEVAEVADIEAETYADYSDLRNIARAAGFRSRLMVPLKTETGTIGAINVTRVEPGPFADHHTQLLKTFADQAVIAIQNVRLFNETKEALARQTATADVLKVIASSPSNLQPVFDAIAERSKALIGAHATTVSRYVDGMLELAAFTRVSPEADATLRKMFPRSATVGEPRADEILRGEITQIVDVEREMDEPGMREIARARGWRSRLMVPLKDGTNVVGWISNSRKEAGAFAEKDIELLQTFADQAVIAIKNVQLFEEVQARTRDLTESLQFQTATSDVLKVISRSPDTLQPVLDVIVETSRELCGADASTIFLLREERFHVAAISGSLPTHLDHLRANPLPIRQRGSILGRIYDHKRTINLENVLDDAELREGSTGLGGPRALLTVPLLSEGQVIGAITLRQPHTRPFTPRQVQAIETFADQAVIAISNVNLFEQVQQRTRELSQSLDDLRTAQDRLIQTEKLASLGQLTAGIAHEIKNPLNFVNNFSALSVELTDELNDLMKQVTLAEQLRKEVDEVTGLLKSNLEKIVQHGKRADSIVKNMLLHSREGSGELRAADINGLVEESLNLAYHGARAEKSGFNITLQREFDANTGAAELFPQEITRALLNLISNGFYAATKRKSENGETDFEPTLSATTRNLGTSVEIRIRDNGMGIPPEVKEKVFNPFFTTKPAGEGTGLGLSMTHDIIVKQHGGTIRVDTEPGAFTEFIVTLPRATNAQNI